MKKLYTLALVLITGIATIAQTTVLANFDFNESSSLPQNANTTASNITASINGTESDASYNGTTTGSNAFVQNTTAGNAMSMSGNTNTNTWTLTMGGSNLYLYASYKLYFQAQRSSTGATTITLSYSTDGTNFTNVSTTASPGNGSYAEATIDMSSITAINNASALYIKFSGSGSTNNAGTLRMDNLEIQGTESASGTNGNNTFFNGNVGIGTNNPAYPLDVVGAARISGALTSGATSVSSLTNSGATTLTGSVTTGALTSGATTVSSLTNSGNLSVTGTTNLTGAVTTGALTSGATNVSSLTNSGNLNVAGTTNLTGAVTTGALTSGATTVSSLNISSLAGGSSLNPLFVDASGNMQLRYSSGGISSSSGTIGYWDLQGNSSTDTTINFIGTTDDKDMIFKTNNTERMRITSHHSNGKEEGRVYIGGGLVGSSDIITVNNDLPGNWDDKLVIKDAIRVVNDNTSPSKCALLGNDGANTYIESFDINQPDQPGQNWYTSPDGILMGWYSGANVYIGYNGTSPNSGNLSVQQNILANNKIGIGTSTPSSRLSIIAPTSGNAFNIDNGSGNLFNIKNDGTINSQQLLSTSTSASSYILLDSHGNFVTGPPASGGTIGSPWVLGGNAGGNPLQGLGTNDGSDLSIITGTGTEKMRIAASGDVWMNGANKIYLLGLGNNFNHALGYTWQYTNGANNTITIDGPVLYGNGGGALGYNQGANVALQWTNTGAVYIGGHNPTGTHADALLAVYGKALFTSAYVNSDASVWADYVFEKDYKLLPLEEIEKYYKENKHLPDVPSAKEMEVKGDNIFETDAMLLRKIEENMLYLVELKKEVDKLKKENAELRNTINKK